MSLKLIFLIVGREFEAFEFLLRWLRTNTVELQSIFKQRDVEGNTIFHIAATNHDKQVSFKSLCLSL